MAKLIRKTQKVFGQDGATDQFAVFGTMKRVGDNETPDYSKDIEVIQSNAAYSQGWQDAVIANYAPFMEELNSICYSLTYQMSYLLQNGVPEWDDGTTYYINSIVVGSNSLLYRCLTDDCLNVDPTTDDGTNWYNYSLYGANQDLSNLTTAGIDKLHALKGYLDSGKLLSDPQLFESVYYFNHSKFDLSKFTVTGSPTITDDGIITTADSSNYAQLNFDFSQDHTFEIEIKGNNSTATTIRPLNYGYQMYINPNNSNRCLLYVNSGASYQIASITDEALKTNYALKIKIKKVGLVYTIDYIINGTITGTLNTTLATTPTYETYIRFQGSLDAQHSVDLKTLKISNANGIPIFSGNKTGIDTIKPADYTAVGTPTISADGIASGITGANYIKTNYEIGNLAGKSYTIYCRWIKSGATFSQSENIYSFGTGYPNVVGGIYLLTNRKVALADNGTRLIEGITQFATTVNYIDFKLERDVIAGTYTLYSNIGNGWINEGTSNLSTDLSSITSSPTNNICFYRSWNYGGSIDLNAFKIYVNGDLVYQPCLLIPYNESSTGSKIVDVAYRDRVIDVYEQFGSANYYTIDETNQNATLPMGEVYGFIKQKASTDFDNVTQTAIDKALDWIMPDWSRAVNKNPYETYTATQRGWVNAQGYTNQDEIGVKINSNVVAYTQAPGGTGDDSGFACLVPVNVGDQYETYVVNGYSTNERIDFVKFIPCKGEA